jgi:hypothetical protein
MRRTRRQSLTRRPRDWLEAMQAGLSGRRAAGDRLAGRAPARPARALLHNGRLRGRDALTPSFAAPVLSASGCASSTSAPRLRAQRCFGAYVRPAAAEGGDAA